MAATHGLLIYERLLSFAEYRKENGTEMQQAIYDDVVEYLSGISPGSDRMALCYADSLQTDGDVRSRRA